jgi:hypothetical protein
MNPLVDHIAVATAIVGALGYLALRFFGKRRAKNCGGGCGCGAGEKKRPEEPPVKA